MSMAIQASRARYQGTMPGGAPVGDPGLFGFIKGIGRAALATVTGGPMAGLSSVVQSFSPRTATPAQRFEAYQGGGGTLGRSRFIGQSSQAQIDILSSYRGPPEVGAPGARAGFERILPGGKTGMMGGPANSPQPSGYHANKSAYFLQDGTFIPKGSIWVKNRRRNPLNPRALSSSMARITSFKGAASKAGLITIRKPGCKKKG